MLTFDPFRDFDRLSEQLLGSNAGSSRVPRFMPMDLYRAGDNFVLQADLPGVDPSSIDLQVDHGTLTITAERPAHNAEGVQWISSERFTGTFRRTLSLGEGVDTDAIAANYENGVVTVTIPVAERAKPRKIEIGAGDQAKVIEASQAAS